jgi:hypothetical protein
VPEDAGRAEDTRSKLERRTVPRACFNSDLDFRLKMLCHVPKLKEKEEHNEVKDKLHISPPPPVPSSYSPFKGDCNILKI